MRYTNLCILLITLLLLWYAGRPRFDRRPTDTQVLANWPSVVRWTVSNLSDAVVAWYHDGSPIFVSASKLTS